MTLTVTMLIYRWSQVKTCYVRFSNVFRLVKKILILLFGHTFFAYSNVLNILRSYMYMYKCGGCNFVIYENKYKFPRYAVRWF